MANSSEENSKREKLSIPREIAKLQLLADATTAEIAEGLGVPIEEYVDQVLKFAMNPELEPELELIDEEELYNIGDDPIDDIDRLEETLTELATMHCGFRVGGRDALFVIRRGDAVFGYVNICPHAGTPLDWKEGAFLNFDKDLIQCATHGAQLDIATGACVAGPCPGQSLAPVALRIDDGMVMLAG